MPEHELQPKHDACPSPELPNSSQGDADKQPSYSDIQWPGYGVDSCGAPPVPFDPRKVRSHHCAMPSDVVGRDPQVQPALEQHRFRPPTT